MMKTKVFRLFMVMVLSLAFMQVHAAKKTDNITLGKKVTFHSKILKEDRALWIYPADALENKKTKRPVMFLLDGDGHFHHICGLVEGLKRNGLVSDMIIVALPNVDRNRDFLPKKIDRLPTSGKADMFLTFFKEELIPYMEQNYNTAPFRILFGHSYGGVFNFHALFKEPDLFSAHIAVSPSLRYGDEMLIKNGREFFKKRKKFNKFLYYSIGGDESARMKNPANTMFDILKNSAPGDFDWHYRIFENENHGTVPHITAYYALRKLFSGWNYKLPNDREKTSFEGFLTHYKKLSEKYGYEIKPSEAGINLFGYFFLRQKKFDKAIEVLTYNVKQHPDSANVYDSLGEAFEGKNDFKSAIINYAKAVKIGKKKSDGNLNVFIKNLQRVKAALKKAQKK